MAKEDLRLVRVLQLADQGKDVVAIRRMTSRAGVGFPQQVKEKGRFNDLFDAKLDAAIRLLQKKRGLEVGDWGILGRHSAFAGLDMGVDFLGAGPIPMFADGEIVRVVHSGSGWPGIGGLIVVKCDKGPMALHPIYVAEDIKIPASHAPGKRLKKGELLADATGTHQAPGIELGWAGPPPKHIGTLFQSLHGHYTMNPRATAEGTHFWKTLSSWMAKGL